MALAPGTRIGTYEITGLLGAGGMGEVYRAIDVGLGRAVAIKILPDDVAHDAERLARFEREARTLASLNHPNIAILHGLEKGNGIRALVMELVDGQTLAERIATGAIPIDEALPIAKQIAEAVEAAHEQGIIHRDLKPANIKLRPDGTVKVLDFGLAKTLEPSGAGVAGATMSPTITTPAMTQAGVILGTAAYMAPEQAKGRLADKRSDIWAFGCVLYEMLTGRRAFPGDDVSDTLAAVLRGEPEWTALPSGTPSSVQRLLRRALRKDPRQRLQHLGDARVEIDDASAPEAVATAPRRVGAWAAAIAAAFVVAVAAGGLLGRSTVAPASPPELRVEITTPSGMASQFAMAPDGRGIVYARTGRQSLMVRTFDTGAARALPGTESAEYPFWSADGRSIGFFANNKLQRIALDGGLPQALANVLTPAGGSWNRGDEILYVPADSGGVFRVPAAGGQSAEVTPGQLATRAPQFLPDGRHFIFYVARGDQPQGTYVGELGSAAIRRVLAERSPALYGANHLWFVRDGVLMVQRFDAARAEVSGSVAQVADGVGAGLLGPAVSSGFDGPVAYRTQAGQSRRQLIWFDRSGTQLRTVGQEGFLASNPSLSPSGDSLILQRTLNENIDLWLIDLRRDVTDRLTDNPGIDSLPVWAPDGNRVAFNSTTGNEGGMFVLSLDRTRPPERLPLSFRDGAKIACDWSADGRYILYKHFNEQTSTSDLWALPMQPPQPPIGVVTTGYNERDGQFSPDGKWIAYESDEAGSPEIYLQPFPGPGGKVRVSANGGTQVRWRRDGGELFFIAADENLMAVTVDTRTAVPTIGAPVKLFKTRIAPIRSISRQQYVVSPDGQRFLVLTEAEQVVPPLTVVFNPRPSGGR